MTKVNYLPKTLGKLSQRIPTNINTNSLYNSSKTGDGGPPGFIGATGKDGFRGIPGRIGEKGGKGEPGLSMVGAPGLKGIFICFNRLMSFENIQK